MKPQKYGAESMKGHDSKFTRTVGVRIQFDELDYILAKCVNEGRSIASVIRDYVTWGIEQDKKEMKSR